jgi:hypothetical protein
MAGHEMGELEGLLDRIEAMAAGGAQVSVAQFRDCLGVNIFGAALLVLGVLALSPIGDIPGMPTVMSIFILLIATQLLAGRRDIWLPDWLERRQIRASLLERAIALARPPFRLVGRLFRARLTWLTEGAFARLVGGACALLALTLPPLEVVPFGATVPSAAIMVFGLALATRDGLLTLLALAICGAGSYLVVGGLLGLASG